MDQLNKEKPVIRTFKFHEKRYHHLRVMKSDVLKFMQWIFDNSPEKSAYRFQLKKYKKEMENNGTMKVDHVHEVLNEFDPNGTSSTPIFKEEPDYKRGLEAFENSGGETELVLKNDLGQEVMFSTIAVFKIFRTFVCGINWSKNLCRHHKDCMKQYKQKIAACMLKYKDRDGRLYEKSEIEKDVAHLKAQCYYQFLEEDIIFDLGDNITTYNSIQQRFSLPYYVSYDEEERFISETNNVKINMRLAWMKAFAENDKGYFMNLIFDAIQYTVDRKTYERMLISWSETTKRAEKQRQFQQQQAITKSVTSSESQKSATITTEDPISAKACTKPKRSSPVLPESGEPVQSNRCKNYFKNGGILKECEARKKKLISKAAKCKALAQVVTNLEEELKKLETKCENSKQHSVDDENAKRKAEENAKGHEDAAKEYDKIAEEYKTLEKEMRKLRVSLATATQEAVKMEKIMAEVETENAALEALEAERLTSIQKKEAALARREQLRDLINGKNVVLQYDQPLIQLMDRSREQESEKERLKRLVNDLSAKAAKLELENNMYRGLHDGIVSGAVSLVHNFQAPQYDRSQQLSTSGSSHFNNYDQFATAIPVPARSGCCCACDEPIPYNHHPMWCRQCGIVVHMNCMNVYEMLCCPVCKGDLANTNDFLE